MNTIQTDRKLFSDLIIRQSQHVTLPSDIYSQSRKILISLAKQVRDTSYVDRMTASLDSIEAGMGNISEAALMELIVPRYDYVMKELAIQGKKYLEMCEALKASIENDRKGEMSPSVRNIAGVVEFMIDSHIDKIVPEEVLLKDFIRLEELCKRNNITVAGVNPPINTYIEAGKAYFGDETVLRVIMSELAAPVSKLLLPHGFVVERLHGHMKSLFGDAPELSAFCNTLFEHLKAREAVAPSYFGETHMMKTRRNIDEALAWFDIVPPYSIPCTEKLPTADELMVELKAVFDTEARNAFDRLYVGNTHTDFWMQFMSYAEKNVRKILERVPEDVSKAYLDWFKVEASETYLKNEPVMRATRMSTLISWSFDNLFAWVGSHPVYSFKTDKDGSFFEQGHYALNKSREALASPITIPSAGKAE